VVAGGWPADDACCSAACWLLLQPVVRFQLPTSNSVLLSALEWGEVMVVKDTVTYFGRNAGSGAVRDLFLPDRQMVSSNTRSSRPEAQPQ
jgi:hypothetical protein